MKTLRFILGDQLSESIGSLSDIDTEKDIVLMTEVIEENTYVRHHKHKIALILSAMRHFANQLKSKNIHVVYSKIDDPDNTGSFTSELNRVVKKYKPDRIVITEPGEWRIREKIKTWKSVTGIPVEIREDDRFLCTISEFKDWAEGRKTTRMEHFYHEMRKKTGWLMDGRKPVGGKWNYDAENRSSIHGDIIIPEPKRFRHDAITREVIHLTENRFPDHMGSLDNFGWAVTGHDARKALDYFIEHLLPQFGKYQDAMKQGDDFLFHSLLSPYLNIGLLLPKEVCLAALKNKNAPIESIEGFLRQILGWREFIRGIYWLRMPEYEKSNFLNANTPLPKFYWDGKTGMSCMREAIGSTIRNAYAHHIHRLMITGNFALLAGLSPRQVEHWYLAVYADAFEWVELPNTHGMVLHADGGHVGSKPYAASGSYINRMSNYCRNCKYNPKNAVGADACPFNFLYWNFIDRNKDKLSGNPRMAMPYRNLERMDKNKRDEMSRLAEQFISSLKS